MTTCGFKFYFPPRTIEFYFEDKNFSAKEVPVFVNEALKLLLPAEND